MTSEFVGTNRAVVKWGGATLFCLHQTVIVAKLSDGATQLSTGGWDTPTTWKWIGIALRRLGSGITFEKDKKTGQRFVLYAGMRFPFKDGIIVGRRLGWDIDVTEVNCDYRGCPRYVVHFGNLLTEKEKERWKTETDVRYNVALARARLMSGRKFNNKQFGGGIVFAEHLDRNQIAERIAKMVMDSEARGF